MNFFEKLKKKACLKRILKNERFRKKEFHYLTDSQNIGVLLEVKKNDFIDKNIENFLSEISEKKNVRILKFFDEKIKKGEELPLDTISIQVRKWRENEILKKFTDEYFDILIVIAKSENIRLHYMISKINADLKVSPYFQEFNFADLTFIIKDGDINTYLQAVKNYLCKN